MNQSIVLEKPKEPEAFHKRLERLRKEQGLTAKEMARKIGVPVSTYRQWEYGRGMKLPPLQKISQVFAISVTELATGQRPDWESHLKALEALEKSLSEIRMNIASLL